MRVSGALTGFHMQKQPFHFMKSAAVAVRHFLPDGEFAFRIQKTFF
jgi:hypothetical protein